MDFIIQKVQWNFTRMIEVGNEGNINVIIRKVIYARISKD